ncbi:MAG: RNA-guided endonuclease InsQ/TnpB family protein [Candidatus Hermodarchaeota archaeon]
MVTLTRKFTIIPTKPQVEVLWELSETCRLLYNHALAERKFLYDSYNHRITYQDQQNALPRLKKLFPRYQQVYSKVLQMTLKKLDAAYQSFFGLLKSGDNTTRSPSFRGKSYFFTLCFNQSGFTITKETIKLSHKHPSKTELLFSVPFDFTTVVVKQVEFFQNPYDQQFYIAITYEQEAPMYVDNGLYQAFDLGITKHTAVNIQGNFLESAIKRPDKYWQPRVQLLQRRRDRCKIHSRRHRLFSQRLRSIQRKCTNQTKDWQHKQSKNFLKNTKANTIIVGDLSPKQMVASRKNQKINKYQKSINRGIHYTGHLGRFIELLTYKARLLGKRVIVIDEWATSKTCAVCGHKKIRLYLSERLYHCDVCGIAIDRDQNAAINIMKRFLSHNALWTGYHQFSSTVDNLRYTVKGKTKIPHYFANNGFCELVENHLL